MRQTIYSVVVLALAILLLNGCQTQDELKPVDKQVISLYKLNTFSAEVELIEFEMPAHEEVIETRNPNSIVHADYHTTGTHHVKIKFQENPSGIHGTGSITGPIYIDVKFDAACITEVDNRATIGGLVTFLELGDNPFEFPVELGWYIYMAMEDNGEGKKGPKDKYHGEVYFGNPAFGPLCHILEPFSQFFWIPEDWNDVQGKNDKVVIR